MAEEMQDQFAKQAMMDVVATYEKLAAHTRFLEEKDGKKPAKADRSRAIEKKANVDRQKNGPPRR